MPIHDLGGANLPALASKGAEEPPTVPIRVKIDDYRTKPGRENGQTFRRIQHRQRQWTKNVTIGGHLLIRSCISHNGSCGGWQ